MTKIHDFSHLVPPGFREGLARSAAKYRADNNLEAFVDSIKARR